MKKGIARIATTGRDRQNEAIAPHALHQMAQQYKGQSQIILNSHDWSQPPLGRSFNHRVEPFQDGFALLCDQELFESSDTLDETNDTALEWSTGRHKVEETTILIDNSVDREEFSNWKREFDRLNTVDTVRYGKKGLGLVTEIGILIGGAFIAGLAGKAGSDAWDSLKKKVAEFVDSRTEAGHSTTTRFEMPIVLPDSRDIFAMIIGDASEFDVCELIIDSMDVVKGIPSEVVTKSNLSAVVFKIIDGELQFSHGILSSCAAVDEQGQFLHNPVDLSTMGGVSIGFQEQEAIEIIDESQY